MRGNHKLAQRVLLLLGVLALLAALALHFVGPELARSNMGSPSGFSPELCQMALCVIGIALLSADGIWIAAGHFLGRKKH